MSAFKELVARDVKDTFLDTDYFSDSHEVNGKDMPVQVDNNEQINREKRRVDNADGIFRNQKLIYVSAVDYGPLPRQGSTIKFDGRTYKVMDAISEDGIYSITIEEYRGM